MTDKDKQIEEIAIELGVDACKKTGCINCAVNSDCIWLYNATRLYNLGYRLASAVIDEVIKIVSEKAEEESEYFDRMRLEGKDGKYFEGGKHTCEMLLLELYELKKKYESEGVK